MITIKQLKKLAKGTTIYRLNVNTYEVKAMTVRNIIHVIGRSVTVTLFNSKAGYIDFHASFNHGHARHDNHYAYCIDKQDCIKYMMHNRRHYMTIVGRIDKALSTLD